MDPSSIQIFNFINYFFPGIDRDFKNIYVKAGRTVDQGRCRRIESISIVDVSLLNIKPPIKKKKKPYLMFFIN